MWSKAIISSYNALTVDILSCRGHYVHYVMSAPTQRGHYEKVTSCVYLNFFVSALCLFCWVWKCYVNIMSYFQFYFTGLNQYFMAPTLSFSFLASGRLSISLSLCLFLIFVFFSSLFALHVSVFVWFLCPSFGTVLICLVHEIVSQSCDVEKFWQSYCEWCLRNYWHVAHQRLS